MTTLTARRRNRYTVVAPAEIADFSSITSVRLGLAGGTLVFDVQEHDPVASVEIFDADAAAWWLFSLYGVEAAETILDIAAGDREDAPDPILVEVVHGALADRLRRLALALWLRRWWPQPSDSVPVCLEWLLDAEAAVLASGAEHALDRSIDLSAQLLEPHLISLALNLGDHEARIDGSVIDGVIDAVVVEAAQIALEVSDPDADGYAVLEEIEARIRATDSAASEFRARLDDEGGAGLLASLSGAALSAGETMYSDDDLFALAAGGSDDLEARKDAAEGSAVPSGTLPVDPRAVPPRVLSSAEDAIRWSVDERDGSTGCRIEVEIAPGADPRRTGPFFARVDRGGNTAVTALDFWDGVLVGTAWLETTGDLSDPAVTVYSGIDGYDAVAPRAADARRRDRDAIAALVAARNRRAVASTEATASRWDNPFAAELAHAAEAVPVR